MEIERDPSDEAPHPRIGDDRMLKFVEMDESTSFFAQMGQDLGTVILINEFTVAPERHRRVFEGVDSRRRCDEAATRLHLHSAAQGYWWKPRVRELRGLGVRGGLQAGV